jgi:small subunit ribosomal protein S12
MEFSLHANNQPTWCGSRARSARKEESKSPALGRIHNALKVRYYEQDSPLKRGVCVKVTTKDTKKA